MTSSIPTIALTYNGSDIQDVDGLFLQITQGLDETPTAVRGVDVTVPGADGQTARPRRFHERRIVLAGHVRGVGATQAIRQAAYRSNVRAMLDLFPTGGGNSVTPEDLVALLEDDSTATIACRCLSIETVAQVPSEFSEVSIELSAVEDWTYEAPGS